MKQLAKLHLLLLVVILPSTAYSQQPPATNAGFLQSSGSALIEALKLRKPNLANQKEREIDSAVKSLPLGEVHLPGLWICDGCGGAFSHPELGIVIDAAQLAAIVRGSPANSSHVVVVFIVAHEAAHQVQYAKYGKGALTLPLEDRRYLEAQADILAGIWLYQDASVLPFAQASDNETVNGALHAVFDLGVEQYALASHPSREGRAFAVRTGFQVGLSRRPYGGDGFQDAANRAAILLQLGLRTGESDLDFSLRVARRLAVFNSVAALDLVKIESDDNISWDTSSDNPLVSYRVTYANRGAKALHVALEALCLEVLRKDPADFFQSIQVSSKLHDFEIPAGGRTTITGQLRWIATEDHLPSLRLPPDDLGLVEVHYADGSDRSKGAPDSTPMRSTPDGTSKTLPTEPDAYATEFLNLAQLSLHGYLDVRKGPGIYWPEFGDAEYDSTEAIPRAIGSKVHFIDKFSALTGITSTLLRTTDVTAASAFFEQTVSLVRTALKATQIPHSVGDWRERSSDYDKSDDQSVSFYQTPYRVQVDLNKVEEGGGQDVPRMPFFYVRLKWAGLPRSVSGPTVTSR